jgi:hypothetical protein
MVDNFKELVAKATTVVDTGDLDLPAAPERTQQQKEDDVFLTSLLVHLTSPQEIAKTDNITHADGRKSLQFDEQTSRATVVMPDGNERYFERVALYSDNAAGGTGLDVAALMEIDAQGQPLLDANGKASLRLQFPGNDMSAGDKQHSHQLVAGELPQQLMRVDNAMQQVFAELETRGLPSKPDDMIVSLDAHSFGSGAAMVAHLGLGREGYVTSSTFIEPVGASLNMTQIAMLSQIHAGLDSADVMQELQEGTISVSSEEATIFRRALVNGNAIHNMPVGEFYTIDFENKGPLSDINNHRAATYARGLNDDKVVSAPTDMIPDESLLLDPSKAPPSEYLDAAPLAALAQGIAFQASRVSYSQEAVYRGVSKDFAADWLPSNTTVNEVEVANTSVTATMPSDAGAVTATTPPVTASNTITSTADFAAAVNNIELALANAGLGQLAVMVDAFVEAIGMGDGKIFDPSAVSTPAPVPSTGAKGPVR